MVGRGAMMMILGGLVACGESGATPTGMQATVSFTIDTVLGNDTSPIQPLVGQPVGAQLDLQAVMVMHGERANCKTTALYSYDVVRTASGPVADVFQREELDTLPEWWAELERCPSGSGFATGINLHSEVDDRHFRAGCTDLPGVGADDSGYPNPRHTAGLGCLVEVIEVDEGGILDASNATMTLDYRP